MSAPAMSPFAIVLLLRSASRLATVTLHRNDRRLPRKSGRRYLALNYVFRWYKDRLRTLTPVFACRTEAIFIAFSRARQNENLTIVAGVDSFGCFAREIVSRRGRPRR